MRNFLLLISLCFFSVIADAKTYYTATTGSDSNPGTILLPFKTLAKGTSVLVAGDILYIRGGIYYSTAGNAASAHFRIQNLTGTSTAHITISAYPNEVPIFDCYNVIPTYSDPYAMYFASNSYVNLKGRIILRNLRQIADGSGISRGLIMAYSNNCTLDFLDIYNMGGTGLSLTQSNNNLVKNCDFHHNGDGLTVQAGGNLDSWNAADGFSDTGGDISTGNVFDACRMWMNSDDGCDFFDWNGTDVTVKNCWSFWNSVKPWGPNNLSLDTSAMTPGNPALFFGTSASQNAYKTSLTSGEGFKAGGGSQTGHTTTLTKKYWNCLAFENVGSGFPGNALAANSGQYQYYNCAAYKNGKDGFQYASGWATGIAHYFKNCWSWNNSQYSSIDVDWSYDGLSTNISNNVWGTTYNGVNYGNLAPAKSITAADFLSVSSVGMDAARQADGSLPNVNFLHLTSNSDLINIGANVGLSFVAVAPDMGPFEFGASIIVPVTLTDFTATEKSGKSLLQWTTATEINSNHFEVERSTDGQNYEKIATVSANGNTNVRINYQATDNYPSLGVNYYRLKMVDNDGTFKYSKIVSVNFKNSVNTGSFEIKTAMVSHKTLQLNVSSSVQQQAYLSMYDAEGRVLFTSNITLQKGMNNVNKVITPSTGVYFLKLKTNDAMTTLPLLNAE